MNLSQYGKVTGALLTAFFDNVSDVSAQSMPRVMQVSVVASTDSSSLSDVGRIVIMRNGKIMVNDIKRRRLILLDESLRLIKVVADTNDGSAIHYGIENGPGALLPYLGDSSLMLDGQSRTLVVIDPDGKFARTMAPVHQNDLLALGGGINNAAATDKFGRLIIRGPSARVNVGEIKTGATDTTSLTTADSAPILRENLERRVVDTLAFVRVPPTKSYLFREGKLHRVSNVVNPLPTSDEWVLLPDGTIAIVRSHDYHVDWVSPNKKVTSSPKLSFDWKRVSDEYRIAIVDSMNRELLKQRTSYDASGISFLVSAKPDELPEYFPPISPGNVFADQEGNVWILPTTSKLVGSGLVYDVINREGVLVRRVRLPEKRVLAGLGLNGAIYMRAVLRPGIVTLERAIVASE